MSRVRIRSDARRAHGLGLLLAVALGITALYLASWIDTLRDPTRFRSWLVTITMRQINERRRSRRQGPVPLSALGPAQEPPDPGAEFADLTITRLGLSGERREVAAATAWLDASERRLLALWWLEAAGELTWADLTAAMSLSPAHAAVRVRRMKNQLTEGTRRGPCPRSPSAVRAVGRDRRILGRPAGRALAQAHSPACARLRELRRARRPAHPRRGAARGDRDDSASSLDRRAYRGHA